MSDPKPWLAAVRRSHDRLTGLVADLDADGLRRSSACSEWTVAQVLSHLGSQAEIFSLMLDAGLSGGPPLTPDTFAPIWDTWNARSPEDQAAESTAANEAFVTRMEGLDAETLAGFRLETFGRTFDATGLLRMRLSEHAIHTWDVEVSFDPAAAVAGDAVDLLVDGLGEVVGRSGQAPGRPIDLSIATTAPRRRFRLSTGEEVRLVPDDYGPEPGADITLPAEALVRLVYGRLGPLESYITPEGVALGGLVSIFPGF